MSEEKENITRYSLYGQLGVSIKLHDRKTGQSTELESTSFRDFTLFVNLLNALDREVDSLKIENKKLIGELCSRYHDLALCSDMYENDEERTNFHKYMKKSDEYRDKFLEYDKKMSEKRFEVAFFDGIPKYINDYHQEYEQIRLEVACDLLNEFYEKIEDLEQECKILSDYIQNPDKIEFKNMQKDYKMNFMKRRDKK